MKGSPIQLARGNSLKTQIYNSISKHKLASTTRLLRNTLHSQLRFGDLVLQGAQMKTEICSPAPKSDHSMHKMCKSVNEGWAGKKQNKRGNLRSKDHLGQKCEHKRNKTDKPKAKSQILAKPKPLSHEKGTGSRKQLNLVGSTKKMPQKGKPFSNSCRKINLESIIEQSSSQQQLITPDNKKRGLIKKQPSLSRSRTKKKQKNELISQSMKRKIQRGFKEPEIFQKILKLPFLTIGYRILKKRLIEIEIYTLRPLETLKVSFDRGNLECQNIHEEYSHVSQNTLLALFSSVRSIDTDNLNELPKVHIEVQCGEDKVERSVILPYTWLHFAEERPPSLKKSKIKTKLCLYDLPISSTNLHVLSDIFKTWFKKSLKGQSQFQTSFILCDQEYSLKLLQQVSQKFSLQLQGRGQVRLLSMIQFLQALIC